MGFFRIILFFNFLGPIGPFLEVPIIYHHIPTGRENLHIRASVLRRFNFRGGFKWGLGCWGWASVYFAIIVFSGVGKVHLGLDM